MNRKSLVTLLLISCFIAISCSSDDGNTDNPQAEKDYFPLSLGNNWDYINVISTENQPDMVSSESLSISGTSIEGANTTYEFETTNPMNSAPTTLALSSGVVYKEGTALFYTGSFGLGIPEISNFNVEVENGIIYDKNSPEGAELFSIENTIQEQLSGVNINITYTLSSVMGNTIESMSVNGELYEDVLTSKLIVNVIATTEIGIPQNFLDDEKVVEITNYFAKDVGLIKSETDTNFNFISFPTIPLEDVSFFTLQELQSYNLNIE